MKRLVRLGLVLTVLLPLASWAAELPAPEYDVTKELIGLVTAAADLVATSGVEAACAEFREPGRWFQGESYVFVLALDGTALCHPARPALEGQPLIELKDPQGKPIVQTFLREVSGSKESGWVHYLWPQPDRLTFYWKTSHVRQVEAPDGRKVIVGSGVYEMPMERFFIVEQVNDAVDLIQQGKDEAFEILRDRSSGFVFYDSYVFVLDSSGRMLVNAGFPQLEGTDVSKVRDIAGKLLMAEMMAVTAETGEGWLDYDWPRPGSTLPAPKSSFVRRVEDDGEVLLVGAGVYFR